MNEAILVVGTRAMAAYLGVGRDRLQIWLSDPKFNFPAFRKGPRGRWIATRENLRAWCDDYFKKPRLFEAGACPAKRSQG